MKGKRNNNYSPESRISRRSLLRGLGASALLGMGLWPGCATRAAQHGSARAGNFKFIVVNDTHYMSAECGRWLEKVVTRMRQHQEAEFCLHLGDLTEKGQRQHMAAVRDIFQGLKLPFYPQIGNHDYLTQTDRKAYEELFPQRLNYWFELAGWQFIGLDSSEGMHYEKTSISPETMRWVNEHLPKWDRGKPTVLFTHFPLGEEVNYQPVNADYLLECFVNFNLQAAFSGHFHGFTERWFFDTPLTTNKCCALKRTNHDGTKEKGYFLCTASPNGIERKFIEVTPE